MEKNKCYKPLQALQVVHLGLLGELGLRELPDVFLGLLSVPDKLEGGLGWVHVKQNPRHILHLRGNKAQMLYIYSKWPCGHGYVACNQSIFDVNAHLLLVVLIVEIF